uniref:eCIS core domain-containing protein n=1 Tax=Nostoc piscinale TaxID=224012 RepID=UPI0039A51D10
MYTRQYKTKKTSTNSAETSTTNQFAPRRFVIEPDQEITNNQTSDLQAKSDKKRNLPNISVFPSSVTLQPSPIQMKLTIGQPGDKYEQEADRLAADVVQQINAPETQQVQREAAPEEEEVQMKPISGSIQREPAPEEEEVQMKPISGNIQREPAPEEEEVRMKPIVQRLSGAGGMTATPDLEQSIQQARSSGQPLTESIREPMEQAFGADFSGVKIHADAQSNELNQSIQAKAFTTGKDIFFRQGEYQPGNRGGQELIAHELTHVVQQSGSVVQRNISNAKDVSAYTSTNTLLLQMVREKIGAITTPENPISLNVIRN